MDATVTIEPHELPELTAFYREHEDPSEFECSEEIEVRIEDLEYEDGYAGDRFCPPEPAGLTGGFGNAFLILADRTEVEITDVQLVGKIIDLRGESLEALAAEAAAEQAEYEEDCDEAY